MKNVLFLFIFIFSFSLHAMKNTGHDNYEVMEQIEEFAKRQRELAKKVASFTESCEDEDLPVAPKDKDSIKTEQLKMSFNFIDAAVRILTKRVERLEAKGVSHLN